MKQTGKLQVRDTLEEPADPRVAALVVVDLQNDFCHPDGSYALYGKDMRSIAEMLSTVIGFIR